MEPDYKELLIKYVNHIKFHEGIDYLSEGRAVDSKELSETEIKQIQGILGNKYYTANQTWPVKADI